jgi:putative phosphoribosyl transferase
MQVDDSDALSILTHPFADRTEAGHALARLIQEKVPLLLKTPHPPRIIALLRGGFPVARALAQDLKLPLGALLIQKIASPDLPEIALGALAEDGSIVWNEGVEQSLPPSVQTKLLQDAQKKLRIKAGFEHRIFPQSLTEALSEKDLELAKALVLLVDDGVATGASVHAAAIYLQSLGIQRIRLCVPVIARDTYQRLYERGIFEAIHACEISSDFQSVSQAYQKFPQVEWKELATAASRFTSSHKKQSR